MSATAHRTVLVTGAASGIGLAVARALHAQGTTVLALDRDASALDRVPELLGGERLLAATLDVAEPALVGPGIERLLERVDGVDGLVNCAGTGGFTGDVTATSVESWQRVLAVNLTGAFLVSRAVVPAMLGRDGPSIVHVSSQYGLVGGAGFPAYCAAKAGLIGLTRAMAVDHASQGIRVNCVCPGPTDTPMLRRSAADRAASDREAARVGQRSLLPAPGAAEHVAETIVFLLGRGSANITGAIVPVDGGWSAA